MHITIDHTWLFGAFNAGMMILIFTVNVWHVIGTYRHNHEKVRGDDASRLQQSDLESDTKSVVGEGGSRSEVSNHSRDRRLFRWSKRR